MKSTHNLSLFTLLLLLFIPSKLSGQMYTKPQLSWDEFLQEYTTADFYEEGYEEGKDILEPAEFENLEYLSIHPLQVNIVTRDELLQIPFLDVDQIDSLLSFRQSKHTFYSLGDLQLVSGFDYQTRRWLSLFVRCDTILPRWQEQEPTSIKTRIKKYGRHEVLNRFDIPLYKRDGFLHTNAPTSTNHFMGNALYHLLRYRFHLKKELNWGFLMEKDAGEPVAKQGFYPYDHISGYLSIQPKGKNWQFTAGDFEVKNGRGLIFGTAIFGGNNQLTMRQRPLATPILRPHTSVAEYGYFRGAAFSCHLKQINILTFASFRQLDARMDGDTIRTILQTGLHRTLNEIVRRNAVNSLSGGFSVSMLKKKWGIGVHAVSSRYSHYVKPEQRFYNKEWFKGYAAHTLSSTYFWKHAHWTIQGETASDHKGHIAIEHLLGIYPSRKCNVNLQFRHFSPAFTSLYGKCIQQGSNVRNEQGLMVGGYLKPSDYWEFKSTVDLFRYLRPSYTSILPNAKGIAYFLEISRKLSRGGTLQVRYKIKSRQRTIPQHTLMEYRTTQRLSFTVSQRFKQTELTGILLSSIATSQTKSGQLGLLVGNRVCHTIRKHWHTKLLVAWFKTTDYASAVYLQTPQLLHSSMSTAFMNHGAHINATIQYTGGKLFRFGLQSATTRYFDKKEQSSGVMQIHSPWKSDLILLLAISI